MCIANKGIASLIQKMPYDKNNNNNWAILKTALDTLLAVKKNDCYETETFSQVFIMWRKKYRF